LGNFARVAHYRTWGIHHNSGPISKWKLSTEGNGGRSHDERHPITFQIELIQATRGVFQKIAIPISSQVEKVVTLPVVVNRKGSPLKVLVKQQAHCLGMSVNDVTDQLGIGRPKAQPGEF